MYSAIGFISCFLSSFVAGLQPGINSANQHVFGPVFKPMSGKQPNIVFILTDDQDLHMNSLDYMPLLQKHLIDKGTLFKRHFCTTAICCPAR